jgi:hypothetical protein
MAGRFDASAFGPAAPTIDRVPGLVKSLVKPAGAALHRLPLD